MVRTDVIVAQGFETITANALAAAGLEAVEVRKLRYGQGHLGALQRNCQVIDQRVCKTDFAAHEQLPAVAAAKDATSGDIGLLEIGVRAE